MDIVKLLGLIISFFFLGTVQSNGSVAPTVSVVNPAVLPATEVTLISSSARAELAKCLTQKGVVMYGAYWCPHCQSQKKLFAESFPYINYQECDAKGVKGNPEICRQAGIEFYPTWKIPGQPLLQGEQSLAKLAAEANCLF